jgi:hypothetical protein
MGEKIFASYPSIKGLRSRIYRELKNLTVQRINTPVKKCAHELKENSQRKRYKWPINT